MKHDKNDSELKDYLDKCSLVVNIDTTVAYDLARAAIRYYRGDKSMRTNLRVFQDLESRWYKSLEMGAPDYTVYDDPYFMSDVWACWIVYSQRYLKLIASPKSLFDKSVVDHMTPVVKNIGDLGCGCGYTTANLKVLFPTTDVTGTNLRTSPQFNLASELGKTKHFNMVENLDELGQKDLIFASEYFEHFEKPLEHLRDVITKCQPKFLIIANAFNAVSLGHFHKYDCDGKLLSGKQTSKKFNSVLRQNGYKKLKTTLWNDKPNIWEKCN